MASAREPSTIEYYAVSPMGHETLLYTARVEITASTASPDGVPGATMTRDNMHLYPLVSTIALSAGWRIRVKVILDASDGLDVSDGFTMIPIKLSNGTTKYLNNTDLGNTTDYPAGTIAGIPLVLGLGYEIPNGQTAYFGGDYGYQDVEDDTA